MNNINVSIKRFYWVDKIKIIACILVVLGHFYMSMISSKILSDSVFYNYIIQTIYTFHVPLFFVCSGFLYQHSNRVHSFNSWRLNIVDKFINLGVPYFTFTILTLALKTMFSADVNNPAGELFETLFVTPVAPYWYLYVLFVLYLITPCMRNKKNALFLFLLSLSLKIVNISLSLIGISLPYIISSVSGNLIWFALGIYLYFEQDKFVFHNKKWVTVFLFVIPVVLSLLFYRNENTRQDIKFLIGFLFTISIVSLFATYANKDTAYSTKLSELFMPIYVLHTICAAGVRIILLKLGISNAFIHIFLGTISSFLLPAIIYYISLKIPVLLFFFYPKKTFKYFKEKRKCR